MKGNMKKIFKFLPIALMGMLILAGCKKDGFVTFRATTQPYDAVGKMYIEDNYSCWENGDQVKINSSTVTATVNTSSSGSYVELSGVAQAENYHAIYPASACAGTFGPSASITLPSVQTYRMENGHQVLTAPMAAMAYDRDEDGSRVLRFQNLCLILKVHLEQKNNIIKAIKIVDSTGTVPLSGTGTVSFSGTPAVPSLTMTSSNYEVTLNMASGVNLNVSGGTDFYIAVPTLATGKTLWIHTKDMLNQTRKLAVTTHQQLHSNTIVRVDGPSQVNNDSYDFYDYIQSEGSGYIDLGVKPAVGAKMELTFSLTSTAAAEASQYLCGSRATDANNTQWFTLTGSNSSVNEGFYATLCGTNVRNTVADGGWARVAGKKYRESVEAVMGATNVEGIAIFENLTDGYSKTRRIVTSRTDIPDGVPNVFVFALKAGQLHPGMRCYGFTYSQGGTVLHDFVPCQEKTGSRRVGVYDMKTGEFIPPTQTGATPFTVGNDPKP